jgi:hypothetical protein
MRPIEGRVGQAATCVCVFVWRYEFGLPDESMRKWKEAAALTMWLCGPPSSPRSPFPPLSSRATEKEEEIALR